jgi:hypothetical protein
MVEELRHVDVSDRPELRDLAEEVARSGVGLVLQENGRALATISPMTPRRKFKPTKKTKAQLEAFWSSAGGWADVDVDEFMKYVYEGRQSSKPPVDL